MVMAWGLNRHARPLSCPAETASRDGRFAFPVAAGFGGRIVGPEGGESCRPGAYPSDGCEGWGIAMALELAEVAAGLPMAASFALAGGLTTLREGRRRSSLNAAMHELRRPLQVLTLALPDR